jgi:hypothetical protein
MDRIKRSSTLLTIVFLLAFLGGCALGMGGPELSPMHRQFTRTIDIHTGIILGDLERARAAAEWLLDQEPDPRFPAQTDRYQAVLSEAAGQIVAAEQPEPMAGRVGEMAAACGNCHRAVDGGPRFAVGSEAAEGGSNAKHMIRHLWAVDRMWEGLVGPSDDSWMAGGQALLQGWDGTEDLIRGSGSPDQARSFLTQLNHLGNSATAATTQEARAVVFGDVLEGCVGCHRQGALQDGP